MMKRLLLLVALLIPFSAAADISSRQNEQEIAALLAFVKKSPCQFNRNGSWYAARDAADHIETKYHAAVEKGVIHSAEDFIQYAASKSSLTGTSYKVRCEGTKETACADWLAAELKRLRENSK
jgi:hypothetical protein